MKLVPNAVSRKVAITMLKTKKSSPTILFAAGVVGVVGTTVLACKATLKLEEVLEESSNNMEKARSLHDEGRHNYGDTEFNQDMTKLYIEAAVSVVKLYAPAIALGVLSISALAGSHNILNKRNAALGAAYAAVENSFAEYRRRVAKVVGEDKERELRYGSTEVEHLVETSKGPKVVHDKRYGNTDASPYARVFDEVSSHEWKGDREYNRTFIELQEKWCNDRLRARGFVTLNEVLERLGLSLCKAGQVVGWVWDPRNEIRREGQTGDNYISFGINRPGEQFFHGPFNAILLDFNVDGNILDLIERI